MKDVHNLIAGIKAEERGSSDDIDVADLLVDFTTKDEDNAVSVDATSTGETGVISLTSAHMRHLFDRFPELLLVDSTHKTNRWVFECTFQDLTRIAQGLPGVIHV